MLTGGIAKADPLPAPGPVPSVPGLNMLTQLINPSNAPQLLQAATSMFNPKPAAASVAPAAAAAPAAPAPLATASLNLPQVPGTVPAVQAPTLGNSGDLPTGALPSSQLTLPNVPGLPMPLPQALSFPGDLAALMPGAPGAAAHPASATAPAVPAASATSPMPGLGALFPTSALP
jgi:hypothetical protein